MVSCIGFYNTDNEIGRTGKPISSPIATITFATIVTPSVPVAISTGCVILKLIFGGTGTGKSIHRGRGLVVIERDAEQGGSADHQQQESDNPRRLFATVHRLLIGLTHLNLSYALTIIGQPCERMMKTFDLTFWL